MKHPEFLIANRKVGYNQKPLVIAELGINHNGDLMEAKKMVDAALGGGAEIIKHQTHVPSDEMSELAKSTIPGNSDKSIYQIMEECSLNEKDEFELMNYVKEKGAIFISTPFSRAAADRLAKFDIPAYKIGSGECNNLPLLKHICEFGKPLIISTGMNSIKSIDETVKLIRGYDLPFALLHTTNLYPTPYELVRLGGVTQLIQNYSDAVVGLSDHTIDNYACFGAVALGASILERHFTDSKDRLGPDIACSMTPYDLAELIKGSEIIAKERGGDKLEDIPEEQVTRDFAFATVVTINDIKEGDEFSEENIWVKRPGVGEIHAREYISILGKKANKNIAKGKHLSFTDLK
ncbi:MAG: N-acetylneuraminate synthase family protein [Bacteroidota bacterium]